MLRLARAAFTVPSCDLLHVILQDKYYADKMEIKRGDAATRRRVVDAFVEGLHWVLEYYYRYSWIACR